ncbi:MAG: hypothetical protein NZ927_08005 [Candidatus Calescibacterium sp.]|nr:hypothetical protein [Candidatus Calescibacterium sp.]MCX7733168.1 hypothetical protein [bacterium]MDW8087823.1 hypothetical protein [Candidatus Calescibacterium sp.]
MIQSHSLKLCCYKQNKVFYLKQRYRLVFRESIKVQVFFPEYRDKKIIPVVSSLYIHSHVVKYATRKRVYVVGLKGDEMQILNLFLIEKSLRN